MKMVIPLLIVASCATGPGSNAQEPTGRTPALPAAPRPSAGAKADPPAPAARKDDEEAIKALVGDFTKAFNAGEVGAVAATYTETALVVDEQGGRVEGRAAIRDQYAASFAESPGSTIAIRVDSLRFLGPETALEEGQTTIKSPAGGEGPEITRFTAVYVKQGGRWLQSAVRDEVVKEPTPHDRLKELEWLVGDWVNESDDAVVQTTCKWADEGNFLVREFTMKTRGEKVLSGTQRIGWDPERGRFKMWVFDSEGGFGEGDFAHDGGRWVIKSEGVRRDGKHASATNIITRLGKDRLGWQSVDRTLGGSAIGGIDEFIVVRKPPAAGK